jgi:signal transduction histidine kinase
LNLNGQVIARTGDLSGTTLPLTEMGLDSVQKGATWFETAQVDNEPLLIFTRQIPVGAGTTNIAQFAAPISEREEYLSALRLFLLIAIGFVILIAAIIGWVVSGTALSPINRITQTAQAIGAEHDFGRRVDYSGPPDEVGRLATTFNSMLGELETAYLQQEHALEAQRRFVADASHELRTPLTTVRGNIELLSHEPPMEMQERADVLADTKDEVNRLIRLVQQLLVLARADAGQPLRHAQVALKPLLEEVCRETKLRAPRHTIACQNLADMSVLGDRDALKQVLVILLDNAIVHTSSGVVVELTSAMEAGSGIVRVRDNGAGIAPAALPHIFERFYRGEESRTGASSGLGLAIAKELVEEQGGAITVESKLGEGTLFTISLPLAKVNAQPSDQKQKAQLQ